MEVQLTKKSPIQGSSVPAANTRGGTTLPRTPERDLAVADTVVLKLENKDAFLKLLARLREEHTPATYPECVAVERIAINRWRQQRYTSVKLHILEREANPNHVHGRPLFTFLDEVAHMERQADRAVRRNIEMLKELKRRNARQATSIKQFCGRETK